MYLNSAASRPLLFSILLFAVCASQCHAAPFQEQSAAAPAVTTLIAPQLVPAAAVELHPLVQKVLAPPPPISPAIVIGFLGGRVKKTNTIHREVQMVLHLRQSHATGVYAEVFQNTHGPQAFREIQRLLDVNHDGVLSLAEKQHARIILYGHSWGASETVAMAWQLEGAGIPVLLAVLVDRVPKFGSPGADARIPANVAQAINFYQTDGLLHGRPTIQAADPTATKILGNLQLDYKTTHVACDEYPWYARAFMGPHIEIENDPRVWDKIESLIASKLPIEKTAPNLALTAH